MHIKAAYNTLMKLTPDVVHEKTSKLGVCFGVKEGEKKRSKVEVFDVSGVGQIYRTIEDLADQENRILLG